jgi:outer membrane protein OmpA-like peptidoglycan-associated protein
MFGGFRGKLRSSTEAEKPFWISYADLMTAVMTLFLVTMAVMLIAITREVQRELSADEVRAKEIMRVCKQVESELEGSPNIYVNCADNRISFGEAGRFEHNDYHLPAEAGPTLARLVPAVLAAANSELGQKWFKQVLIEGYTDTVGSYLFNLHLSLNRSEWVMCQLVDPQKNESLSLTPVQIAQVRDLFLAGGVSFNNARESNEESRRVEMRLQFYARGEKEKMAPKPIFDVPAGDRCQLP